MKGTKAQLTGDVHCRVGSLEIARKCVASNLAVHCRVGSLESSM